jgi:hypothetical protein
VDGAFSSSIAELEALVDVEIEVDPDCNVAMAADLPTGVICPGYFLELKVLNGPFAFHHGGENIPLESGIDLRSHINYVTSYVPVEIPQDVLDRLPTDPGGMGGGGGGDGGGP